MRPPHVPPARRRRDRGVCLRADGTAGVARTAADGSADLGFGDGGVAAPRPRWRTCPSWRRCPTAGTPSPARGRRPAPATRPHRSSWPCSTKAARSWSSSRRPPASRPSRPRSRRTPFASGAGVQPTDTGAAFVASVGTTIVTVPFHTSAMSRLAADGRPVGALIAPAMDLRQDDWTGVVDLDAGRYAIAQTVTTFDFQAHRTSTFGTVSIRLPDGGGDPAVPAFSPRTPDGDLILPRAAVATDGGRTCGSPGRLTPTPRSSPARMPGGDARNRAVEPRGGLVPARPGQGPARRSRRRRRRAGERIEAVPGGDMSVAPADAAAGPVRVRDGAPGRAGASPARAARARRGCASGGGCGCRRPG